MGSGAATSRLVDTDPGHSPTVDAPLRSTAWDRWIRVAWWVMWVAIAARVITVMVLSRGWFFTNDDWDFVARDGIGELFAPHQDHLNVINAAAALVLRAIVGLDYWPGYGLIVALAWPTLAVVAWWTWRRRGVEPGIASVAATLLVWLGSVAYMQFSHVNPAWALAATLIALEFDERRISWRNTGIGLGVSLIAVFANTIGALFAVARLLVALFRRQWNGVITSGVAVIVYAVVRSLVTESANPWFGVGDVIPLVRAALSLVGRGLHTVIPAPTSLDMVTGAILVLLAFGVVVWSRVSYRATALIVGSGIWLALAIVQNYLNAWPTRKFEQLYTQFPNDHVIWSRFANIMLVAVLLAGVPVISARLQGRRIRSSAVAGVAMLLVGLLAFNVIQSLNVFERIAHKSAPLAEIAGGLVIVASESEPTLGDPIHPGMRVGPATIVRIAEGTYPETDVTFRSGLVGQSQDLAWIAASDLADSMLRSDVFALQNTEPDTAWARALARFEISEDGDLLGSWADLGLDRQGCIPISELGPLEVIHTVAFRLSLDSENLSPITELIVLQLDDGFGHSEIGLAIDPETEDGHPGVRVMVLGPDADTGPSTLTIAAPSGTAICLQESPLETTP